MKSVLYKKLMIGFVAILGSMAVNAKTEKIEIGVLAKRGLIPLLNGGQN
jgi:hypothetical protein